VVRTVAGHDAKFDSYDRKLDGIAARLADHDSKLDDLAAGLSSLREAVTHYHLTVIGHGILISELYDRVRRIERHLKLEPPAAK
jgi:hypothetical protein